MLTKVRYNPWWGLTFLILGSLLLIMAFFTGPGINMITMAMLLLLGTLYLVNPLLSVDEEKIQLLSPVGIKGRTYYYREEPVKIEGKKVWIGDKRFRLTRWMAHPDDWRRLVALLENEADGGGKDHSQHLVS